MGSGRKQRKHGEARMAVCSGPKFVSFLDWRLQRAAGTLCTVLVIRAEFDLGKLQAVRVCTAHRNFCLPMEPCKKRRNDVGEGREFRVESHVGRL